MPSHQSVVAGTLPPPTVGEGANLVSSLIDWSPSSSSKEAAPEFQMCIKATFPDSHSSFTAFVS